MKKYQNKYNTCKENVKKAFHGMSQNPGLYYWELASQCILAGIPVNYIIELIKPDSNPEFHADIVKLINRVQEIRIGQKSNYDKIEEFLQARFDFRYNIVTTRTEVKTKDESIFRPIDTYALYSFHRALKKNHIPVHQSIIPAVINSDFAPIYDPIKEYFYGLPKWDGKIDYIGELAETVKTTNNELWKNTFKRWIVALVASGIEEKIINHTLIVFSGSQGIGKSRWMQKLIPSQLKEDHYYSGSVDPRNKDSVILLAECLWIDLDELETLNRTEIGEIKHLITLPSVRIRRPYARYHEYYPRRASFMGSVNTKQFLNDTTGSRRFLTFEVTKIDYDHEIDISKVYAQAYSLFQEGYRYWLNSNDIETITKSNEQFQIKTYEEDLLLESFEPVSKEAAVEFFTATGIIQELSDINGKLSLNNASVITMGKILSKYNFQRLKLKGAYKYAVKRKIAGKKIEEIVEAVNKVRFKNQVFIDDKDVGFDSQIKLITRIVFIESLLFRYFEAIYDPDSSGGVEYDKIIVVLSNRSKVTFDEMDNIILRVLLKVHEIPTMEKTKKERHNHKKYKVYSMKQIKWE